MNIGYQDLNQFQKYQNAQNANTGGNNKDTNHIVPNGGTIFMTMYQENHLLSTGGSQYGKTMEYAPHSTEENPVILVNHNYPDGTQEQYSIYLNDVNPSHATVSEIQALLVHLQGAGIPSLPSHLSYDGKQNFLSLYENEIKAQTQAGMPSPDLMAALKTLEDFATAKGEGNEGNSRQITDSRGFGLSGSEERAKQQEELATLISGYDRASFQEVLEKEKEDADWKSLLKAVDRHIAVSSEIVEEQAQEQLEQWMAQEQFSRDTLWNIHTEEEDSGSLLF